MSASREKAQNPSFFDLSNNPRMFQSTLLPGKSHIAAEKTRSFMVCTVGLRIFRTPDKLTSACCSPAGEMKSNAIYVGGKPHTHSLCRTTQVGQLVSAWLAVPERLALCGLVTAKLALLRRCSRESCHAS
jgi:hypothetical protein